MEEINDSMGEFSEVLKICHGYAGFSTASFPLMKLNIAYQQALTAVRYGTMLNPDKAFTSIPIIIFMKCWMNIRNVMH